MTKKMINQNYIEGWLGWFNDARNKLYLKYTIDMDKRIVIQKALKYAEVESMTIEDFKAICPWLAEFDWSSDSKALERMKTKLANAPKI